jgi:hypothetical protein
VLILAMLGCAVAQAQQPANAPGAVNVSHVRGGSAELEQAFWECDYTVTTSGIGLSEGALCADIQEEMKQRRFAGDFHAMLEWWQQNKVAEHRAVAERRRAAASR